MTLEEMLEELNDSDVTSVLRDLSGSISCLEQGETPADFRCNITNAIDEAE
jgi:hypothetical protein